MLPEEKINVCATCKNRKMNLKKGIVCGLTDEKPQFEDRCDSFIVDEKVLLEEQRRAEYEQFDDYPEVVGQDGSKSRKRIVSIISSVVSFIVFFIIGYNGSRDDEQDAPITERDKLEYTIAQLNRKLPEKLDGGMWTSISLDGNNVIYDLNYETEVVLSGADDIELLSMVEKHYRMNSMNSAKNFDVIDLYEYIKDKPYRLIYRYHDVSSRYLFEYEITVDEIKRAISPAKYKCPLGDIRTAVEYINTDFPLEDADGIVYDKVVFNEDPYELIYTLTFPCSLAEMKSLSKNDMNDFAMDICNDSKNQDAAMLLSTINEYPIVFVFRAANGSEYHRYTHKVN